MRKKERLRSFWSHIASGRARIQTQEINLLHWFCRIWQASVCVCVCVLSSFSHVWLCDPMDCSPLGSSYPWDFPGKNIGVGCHFLLQGIFLTQGVNLGLLHCRLILYCLNHQWSPLIRRYNLNLSGQSSTKWLVLAGIKVDPCKYESYACTYWCIAISSIVNITSKHMLLNIHEE